MPRHQLTTEDRRRAAQKTNEKLRTSGTRYKLTAEDSRKGAATTNAKLHADPCKRHVLTREECRRGAFAGWAKRVRDGKAKPCSECNGPFTAYPHHPECPRMMGWPEKLIQLGIEPCPLDTRPIPAAEKLADVVAAGAASVFVPVLPTNGAEIEAKEKIVSAIETMIVAEPPAAEEVKVGSTLVGTTGAPWPSVPQEWRPALTRLRLGPMPLIAVARSHREPLRAAREAGLVEVAAGDFYKLTDKGRQAIGVRS